MNLKCFVKAFKMIKMFINILILKIHKKILLQMLLYKKKNMVNH